MDGRKRLQGTKQPDVNNGLLAKHHQMCLFRAKKPIDKRSNPKRQNLKQSRMKRHRSQSLFHKRPNLRNPKNQKAEKSKKVE